MEPEVIQRLPQAVINRIAAGEVIVAPFNVIKELLENSIDAGAHRIEIHIENGGYGLIKIRDDGVGIRKKDLPIVCARHTTSKIKKYNDLSTVGTFGFRGEALFSMSCCANVRISSKVREHDGMTATYSDGKITSGPSSYAMTDGTMIEVRDLFYNNSVRYNSRPKATVDTRKITEVVSKYAVAYPSISFTLFSNDRELVTTFGSATSEEVIRLIYNIDNAKMLFNLRLTPIIRCSIDLYLNHPSMTSKKQVSAIFVNGRLIKCREIKKAIETAYSDSAGPSVRPFYVALITIPQEEVDVNVHPSKETVTFPAVHEISEAVERDIKSALEMRRSTHPVTPIKEKKPKHQTAPTTPQRSLDSMLGITSPNITAQQPVRAPQAIVEKEETDDSQSIINPLPEPETPLTPRERARLLMGLPLHSQSQTQSQTQNPIPQLQIEEDVETEKEAEAPRAPTTVRVSAPHQREVPSFKESVQKVLESSSDDEEIPIPLPPNFQGGDNAKEEEEDDIPLLPKPPIPITKERSDIAKASDQYMEDCIEMPMVPASIRRQLTKPARIPKADRPQSSKPKKVSLFEELRYDRSKNPSQDIPMRTLEQLFTPPTVIHRQFRPVENLVILQMRADREESISSSLAQIMRELSFVGCCGLHSFLISNGDVLYLCNTFGLIRDYFRQLLLEGFQNLTQLRLDPPIDIAASVSLIGGNGEEAAKILEPKSAMLRDYFSMSIDGGRVFAMPQLVPSFVPSFSAMPLFLSKLAFETNWEEEAPCLSTVIGLIADVSVPVPDDENDQETLSRLQTQIATIIAPSMKEKFVPTMDAGDTVLRLHTIASLYQLFES